MTNIIEKLVNLWFAEWCKLNNRFEEDFESLLIKEFPELKFTYTVRTEEWILLTDLDTI